MRRRLEEQERKGPDVGSTFPNAHVAGRMNFSFHDYGFGVHPNPKSKKHWDKLAGPHPSVST
jgi:hypothetical protein